MNRKLDNERKIYEVLYEGNLHTFDGESSCPKCNGERIFPRVERPVQSFTTKGTSVAYLYCMGNVDDNGKKVDCSWEKCTSSMVTVCDKESGLQDMETSQHKVISTEGNKTELNSVTTSFGGEVPWCETDKYSSYVSFINEGSSTKNIDGEGKSLLVLRGRIAVYTNGVEETLLEGDYKTFTKGETFSISAVHQSHYITIQGK